MTLWASIQVYMNNVHLTKLDVEIGVGQVI